MASREIDPRLQKLFDDGAHVYSISKLNTIGQCKYEAYMNYVLKLKQKNPGIYGILGGKCHDTLENMLHGRAVPLDIKKTVQEELSDCEMLGVEFPLDRNGNSSIRDNWIANMNKFSENFEIPQGNFETEQLILFNVRDNIWMQGYIDVIKHNDDDSIEIWDWKTSSQFTKDHLIEAGRQLVLYALAKQKDGFKVDSVKWVMLKYCETTWLQKNGKPKSKVSEWRNMIKDLQNPIMKALDDLGLDEIDAEIVWNEALEQNSWEPFPDSIKNKFHTIQYVREYELTPEVIQETMDYINKQINLYESLGDDDINYPPCDIDKQSFFCNSLCGFGGKSGQCKYWVDYCDRFTKEEKDEYEDLF